MSWALHFTSHVFSMFLITLMVLVGSSEQVGLTSFRALFIRLPQQHLSTLPAKSFRNTSLEECAELCVREIEFECQSFDLDNAIGSCRLQNHTHDQPHVTLLYSSYSDHYRTAYEKLYNRIPNHVVTFDHKRKIPELSIEECARRCFLEVEFRCKGFDYEVRLRNCWLTDKTVADNRGVTVHPGTDFYEKKDSGPLEYFINFGYGTMNEIEGVHIYTKVVIGVTLDACAHLCLAESEFGCKSFDFIFNDNSCHLSQYIAANVHGLNTEFRENYRAMHYERQDHYLRRFYATPYAAVLGNNKMTFRMVTPNNCARKCLEEKKFICRSFDYQIQDGTCLLSDVTGSDVGGLINHGFSEVHHFEMKPILDCGGWMDRQEGDIASPNWPRHFYHNMNCTWTIHVPKFRVIKIDFTHFDLGSHDDISCENARDKLTISDAVPGGQTTSEVYCNQADNLFFTSETNVVNITFISDAYSDAPGFRFFYHTDWPCGGHFTEDNGMISSPGWPREYPPEKDCKWIIQSPPGVQIMINFLSVDLERHINGPCKRAFDLVQLFDGNQTAAHQLATFCGRRKNTRVYTSSGNVLLVYFRTDKRVQRKGFHAVYKFLYPEISTIAQTLKMTKPETDNAKPGGRETVTLAYNETSTAMNFASINTESSSSSAFFNSTNSTVTTSNFTTTSYQSGFHTSPQTKAPPKIFNDTMVAVGLKAVFIENYRRPFNNSKTNADYNIITTIKETSDSATADTPTIISIDSSLRSLVLVLMMAFLFLFVVLLLVLIFVVRYYRKRLPKRRNTTNFPHTEESVSLCDKESVEDEGSNKNINLPQPSPSDPPPDVTFSNPLYDRRTNENRRQEAEGDGGV